MVPDTIDLGDGFVLERARPDDAPWVARAVGESLDHLRPYLDWTDPEQAEETPQRARLLGLQGGWERAEQFGFLVRRVGGLEVLGSVGLHWTQPDRYGGGAIEIGYWIHADWCDRGLATRAAGALTTVAWTLDGVERVVIRCDVSNHASAAIPRKLGFALYGTEAVPVKAPAETGTFLVWVRTRAAAGAATESTE
jgi:RimJ/RimL family protein N-acetyltransferase